MLVFDLDKNLEGSFKLHLFSGGSSFSLGLSNDHSIIFILKGRVKIEKNEISQKLFDKNSMFFCSRFLGPYPAIALEDLLFIELRFHNLLNFIDLVYFNKMISTYSPSPIELSKLHVKKILRNFLFNIAYYKQNNISSSYLHDVKRKEFIYLIKELYSEKALARFFSTLFICQNPFRFQVYANYTDECTAKLLAERCFMTTKTFTRKFKAEFETTPHKWIIQQKIKRLEYSLTHEIQSLQEVLDKFHFSNMTELCRFCEKHNIEVKFLTPKTLES